MEQNDHGFVQLGERGISEGAPAICIYAANFDPSVLQLAGSFPREALSAIEVLADLVCALIVFPASDTVSGFLGLFMRACVRLLAGAESVWCMTVEGVGGLGSFLLPPLLAPILLTKVLGLRLLAALLPSAASEPMASSAPFFLLPSHRCSFAPPSDLEVFLRLLIATRDGETENRRL